MRVRSLFLLLGMGLLSAGALAQGTISGQVFTTQGRPATNAAIRVCSSTSTGSPCTPTVAIFSDPALHNQVPNPTAADTYGNYSLFAVDGVYVVQITPSTGVLYSYLVKVGGGGSSTTGGVWAIGTTYGAGSVVQYGGANYLALAASTGVTPGTNGALWSLMASGGGGITTLTTDVQATGTGTAPARVVGLNGTPITTISGLLKLLNGVPGAALPSDVAAALQGATLSNNTTGNAATATQATNANHATSADSATTAGSATTAANATHASSADTATTAGSAATATQATNANHASSADSATTAGSAATASQANHAASADSATTAGSATTAITITGTLPYSQIAPDPTQNAFDTFLAGGAGDAGRPCPANSDTLAFGTAAGENQECINGGTYFTPVKKIVSGSNITVAQTGSTVTISTAGGGGTANAAGTAAQQVQVKSTGTSLDYSLGTLDRPGNFTALSVNGMADAMFNNTGSVMSYGNGIATMLAANQSTGTTGPNYAAYLEGNIDSGYSPLLGYGGSITGIAPWGRNTANFDHRPFHRGVFVNNPDPTLPSFWISSMLSSVPQGTGANSYVATQIQQLHTCCGKNPATSTKVLTVQGEIHTAGIKQGLSVELAAPGIGDNAAIQSIVHPDGGNPDPSAEGHAVLRGQIQQHPIRLAGNINSGGGTGSQAISVTPTQGAGVVGEGSVLVLPSTAATYHVTATTSPGGAGTPASVTVAETLTPSAAYGLMAGTNLGVPPLYGNGTTPVTIDVLIQSGTFTASTGTTGAGCIADAGTSSLESFQITSVDAIGAHNAGYQRLYTNLRFPRTAVNANVAQGGLACQALEFHANRYLAGGAASPLRDLARIVYNTANTIFIEKRGAGGWRNPIAGAFSLAAIPPGAISRTANTVTFMIGSDQSYSFNNASITIPSGSVSDTSFAGTFTATEQDVTISNVVYQQLVWTQTGPNATANVTSSIQVGDNTVVAMQAVSVTGVTNPTTGALDGSLQLEYNNAPLASNALVESQIQNIVFGVSERLNESVYTQNTTDEPSQTIEVNQLGILPTNYSTLWLSSNEPITDFVGHGGQKKIDGIVINNTAGASIPFKSYIDGPMVPAYGATEHYHCWADLGGCNSAAAKTVGRIFDGYMSSYSEKWDPQNGIFSVNNGLANLNYNATTGLSTSSVFATPYLQSGQNAVFTYGGISDTTYSNNGTVALYTRDSFNTFHSSGGNSNTLIGAPLAVSDIQLQYGNANLASGIGGGVHFIPQPGAAPTEGINRASAGNFSFDTYNLTTHAVQAGQGSATLNNLTLNGTCTGCPGGQYTIAAAAGFPYTPPASNAPTIARDVKINDVVSPDEYNMGGQGTAENGDDANAINAEIAKAVAANPVNPIVHLFGKHALLPAAHGLALLPRDFGDYMGTSSGSGATAALTISSTTGGILAVNCYGGAGYNPNAWLPIQILDSSHTGSGGAAYCTTNSSGVPNLVGVVESAGMLYPVSNGSVSATVFAPGADGAQCSIPLTSGAFATSWTCTSGGNGYTSVPASGVPQIAGAVSCATYPVTTATVASGAVTGGSSTTGSTCTYQGNATATVPVCVGACMNGVQAVNLQPEAAQTIGIAIIARTNLTLDCDGGTLTTDRRAGLSDLNQIVAFGDPWGDQTNWHLVHCNTNAMIKVYSAGPTQGVTVEKGYFAAGISVNATYTTTGTAGTAMMYMPQALTGTVVSDATNYGHGGIYCGGVWTSRTGGNGGLGSLGGIDVSQKSTAAAGGSCDGLHLRDMTTYAAGAYPNGVLNYPNGPYAPPVGPYNNSNNPAIDQFFETYYWKTQDSPLTNAYATDGSGACKATTTPSVRAIDYKFGAVAANASTWPFSPCFHGISDMALNFISRYGYASAPNIENVIRDGGGRPLILGNATGATFTKISNTGPVRYFTDTYSNNGANNGLVVLENIAANANTFIGVGASSATTYSESFATFTLGTKDCVTINCVGVNNNLWSGGRATATQGASGAAATTYSVTPTLTSVAAGACADMTGTASVAIANLTYGLATTDRITSWKYSTTWGNVTAPTLTISAANTVQLHFCNPTAAAVTPTAGTLTLQAVHQ